MIIGDFIQGGILFYSGATLLIAAVEDIIIPAYWGCYKTAISGTSTAIGTGSSNTSKIISICTGATIAAKLCDNYSYSGYTDWFLPSKDELNELYLVKDEITELNIYDNYWSSSQNMPETAWYQFFLNGVQSDLGGKDQLYKVRPIRVYS